MLYPTYSLSSTSLPLTCRIVVGNLQPLRIIHFDLLHPAEADLDCG